MSSNVVEPAAAPRHTEAQLRAIQTINQNLQIIACAGSGKTRVVANRVLHILQQAPGVGPENVVAFTFTEKAAAELKDRITKLYQQTYGNVEGLAAMYVGTIHGFCLDLLQRYLPEYLKFDVLDEIGQRLFIDRYSVRSGLQKMGLRRWVESGLYARILGVLREAEVDATQVAKLPIKDSFDMYYDLLDANRYLDYDGLVLTAVEQVMTNSDLRSQLSKRIKYLIVDEYQDVNPIQERLVRELHDLGANLCVVGDDDQNIYQWRGSDVTNIVTFKDRYPAVETVPLETNFRSSNAIVGAARQIVEINANRLPKAMESGGTRSFIRGDLLALTFDDADAEAAWIAGKVKDLRGRPYEEDHSTRGLSWSDCAVLLRSVRGDGRPIIDALKTQGIPYVVTGMTGLFDTSEVVAAEGIFRNLAGEIAAEDVRRLWQAANLGLTATGLDRGVALLEDRKTTRPGVRYATYALQRVYMDFLSAIELREEAVPGGRGEVVYYNLGKFSQVISDYEAIHFKTPPTDKYIQFVGFLRYQAPGYYPEGGQDAAVAVPDAVRVMTVHQAKGMEFPAVFLPSLQRNRFPAKKQHNKVWTYLPKAAVVNADRYDTSIEDERRLMYVAITRAEKFLFCSWSPDAGNQLYRRPSVFFEELTRNASFLTREPVAAKVERLKPETRRRVVNVELSFSDLKYFFECAYEFKLRLLYGFNPPIHEALGYGRSLHNALAEVHKRAIAGDLLDERAVPELVDRHLHVRYAYPELELSLRESAAKSLAQYLRENAPHLDKLEHAEETVELTLPEGVLVRGRIDLIKRTDTGEVVVVDFKSTQRAQSEDVTRLQLHVYALGYEQRFGRSADLIEVHNLDQGGSRREIVDNALMRDTVALVVEAGDRIRDNQLERLPSWCATCAACDLAGICRTRPMAVEG
jgi:DNA helicase-2/ATP-dependent DNA helicase PcrA